MDLFHSKKRVRPKFELYENFHLFSLHSKSINVYFMHDGQICITSKISVLKKFLTKFIVNYLHLLHFLLNNHIFRMHLFKVLNSWF